jgi:hypothetical protein
MSAMDSPQPLFSAETWIATALLGQAVAVDELTDSQWQQIEQTAGLHGVAPMLLHCLSKHENRGAFPAGFRRSLSRPVYQQVAWDLERQEDLGKLLDQFDKAGIRHLLIKGAGLAYTHYEHSYLRVRCDTDILFPDSAAFGQAWALLQSAGFKRLPTISGEFVGYQNCCHRPLAHGSEQVLDCHIKINDYQFYADAFSFDELFSHSVPLPQLAESARTLGAVHALLLACIHRVGTIPHGDADRLIRHFDVYLLARSLGDNQWVQFLDWAKDRKLCGTCVHSLAAAQVFFPVAVPIDVMAQLQQSAENEPFKPGHEMKRWRYYYQVFKTVPGARQKISLLREHFLPSPAYMMEKYQTSNRFKLPFLYVYRVFSGIRRYF